MQLPLSSVLEAVWNVFPLYTCVSHLKGWSQSEFILLLLLILASTATETGLSEVVEVAGLNVLVPNHRFASVRNLKFGPRNVFLTQDCGNNVCLWIQQPKSFLHAPSHMHTSLILALPIVYVSKVLSAWQTYCGSYFSLKTMGNVVLKLCCEEIS